jgi:hypothetical protein
MNRGTLKTHQTLLNLFNTTREHLTFPLDLEKMHLYPSNQDSLLRQLKPSKTQSLLTKKNWQSFSIVLLQAVLCNMPSFFSKSFDDDAANVFDFFAPQVLQADRSPQAIGNDPNGALTASCPANQCSLFTSPAADYAK